MYIGDFLEDEPNIQLDIDTLVNGKMVALAGTPTVAIYKDNSDTEHTTTYTPAVVDGATGAYRVVIDSSAHAFFATGCDYTARFKTGTLGSESLAGRLVGSFSIMNRSADLTHIGGQSISGNNATLKLKELDVTNSAGDAVTFKSTAVSGYGLRLLSSLGIGMFLGSLEAGPGALNISGPVFFQDNVDVADLLINNNSLYTLALLMSASHRAVAQSATAATITLDVGASAVDGFYNDQAIAITGGTGVQQTRRILSYDGTTKVAVISTGATDWKTTPDNTSVFTTIGRIE